MKIKFGPLADFCTETFLFASAGNLCGRIVNKAELILNPSLFTKQAPVNLKAATSLCTLFLIIDTLVKKILQSQLTTEYNRFSITAIRLGFSFQVALFAHQSLSYLVKYTPLNDKNGFITLVAAMSLHILVCQLIHSWNKPEINSMK